jgi:hypothetical protein
MTHKLSLMLAIALVLAFAGTVRPTFGRAARTAQDYSQIPTDLSAKSKHGHGSKKSKYGYSSKKSKQGHWSKKSKQGHWSKKSGKVHKKYVYKYKGHDKFVVGRWYYGGIWYGTGPHYRYGRRWDYGVGECWLWTPLGIYVWICD